MTTRNKPLDEKAKEELREKLKGLAGRMLRPNQRVRKPKKPKFPKVVGHKS